MKTYLVNLTQDFTISVQADSKILGARKACELMLIPGAIYETEKQEYRVLDVLPVTYKGKAREEAEENEVIYSNFND